MQDNSNVTLKRREALVVVSLGIFICLLFLCAIYYLYETSRLEYKTWDVNTVTAADFTVELNITKNMWDTYVYKFKDTLEPNKTLINKFHDDLKSEIEKIVSSEEAVLNNKETHIKVSTIAFAFSNV